MDSLEKQKFIFGSLFLVANRLQAVGDKYLGEGGVTTKQWFLSAIISQFGDKAPTLTEVAELMGSSRQNVKQLALKLEQKDFLRIEKDRQDARAFRLKLTEKSQAFWDKREEKDNRFVAGLFEDFSEEEINVFFSGFKKLVEKVDEI